MSRPPLRAVVLAAVALLFAACGDGPAAAPAAGRYELDRMDYARRLAAEHLHGKDGTPRTDITPEKSGEIRQAALARARALQLRLELRGDGAFMAQFIGAAGEQRLGGTWSQDGEVVVFRTSAVPGGRVTSIPDVQARRTAEGLVFDEAASGFVVPRAFVMRKVD